ncbi:hypothetical protein ACWDYH_08805 [Nocardia goodfellowii]
MKLKKIIAAAATGVALAFGSLGGGLAFGPAVAMADQGFEGHWENCTGEHDGNECVTENGIVTHLNLP